MQKYKAIFVKKFEGLNIIIKKIWVAKLKDNIIIQ